MILIDDRGMRVTWAGALLGIERLELLPSSGLDTVFMEIINAVVSIVAAKDIDVTTMDNCSVAVPWARRLSTAVRIKFTPCVSGEIEAEEVVPPVRTIIAAEYVEVVVDCDRGVKGPWARWVNLI